MGRGIAVLHVVGRVIAAVAVLIALIIAFGILFQVLQANPDNTIVGLFVDVGGFFVGPFDRMFLPKDPRAQVAINWGIALGVYLLAGRLIDRALQRVGPTEP